MRKKEKKGRRGGERKRVDRREKEMRVEEIREKTKKLTLCTRQIERGDKEIKRQRDKESFEKKI